MGRKEEGEGKEVVGMAGTGIGQERVCNDWEGLEKWARGVSACFRHEEGVETLGTWTERHEEVVERHGEVAERNEEEVERNEEEVERNEEEVERRGETGMLAAFRVVARENPRHWLERQRRRIGT